MFSDRSLPPVRRYGRSALILLAALAAATPRASGATTAYVPTRDGFWALDTTNNTAIPDTSLPLQSSHMVLTPDGRFAYVSMEVSNTGEPGNSVEVVSTASHTVVATVTVGSTPTGLAITPDGKSVYVSNNGWSAVWVIGTDTNTVSATIATGRTPGSIAITPDGAFVWVTHYLDNSLSVIDNATHTVVNTVSLPGRPQNIVISADGKRGYVSNGNGLSVIDTATRAVLNTIAFTSQTGGVALTPDGRFLYVTSGNFFVGYAISVIDTASSAVVASIPDPEGGNPAPLSMSPDGSSLYVSNSNYANSASSVSVFSTATNTLLATIPTGIATGPVVFVPGANPALSSLSFNPSNVTGGASSTGTVSLSAGAPPGGATVSLTSDNNSVTVPASVTVAAGSTTAEFPVTTSAVAATETATVSAAYNSTTRTAELILAPSGAVSIASVAVNPIRVTSEETATGTVVLSAPAPAGGTAVELWTNGSPAFVPPSVTIPPGSTSGTFTVTTNWVTSPQQGTITAFYQGQTKTAAITVTPMPALVSVSVPAESVGSGYTAIGTVTLSDPAPAGGILVYLWTNGSPAFVPASVTVAPGATSATFAVTTNYVAAPTQGTITAFYLGMIRTTTVTVIP
jgi:YVTN family beta-propeller protein